MTEKQTRVTVDSALVCIAIIEFLDSLKETVWRSFKNYRHCISFAFLRLFLEEIGEFSVSHLLAKKIHWPFCDCDGNLFPLFTALEKEGKKGPLRKLKFVCKLY